MANYHEEEAEIRNNCMDDRDRSVDEMMSLIQYYFGKIGRDSVHVKHVEDIVERAYERAVLRTRGVISKNRLAESNREIGELFKACLGADLSMEEDHV